MARSEGILLLAVSGLVVLTGPRARAADGAPSTACVEEIQRVCHGEEDALETCLVERSLQISKGCREQLQTAIDISSDPSAGACVSDVKTLCQGLESDALAHCIVEKQTQLSQACRDDH